MDNEETKSEQKGVGGNGNLIPPVKGEVRNPHGRPVGSKNLSTIIRELEAEDFNWDLVPIKQKDMAKKTGSPWRAMVYVALAKAMSGDVPAMKWLSRTGYGDKIHHEFDESFFQLQKIEVEIVKSKTKDERDAES